MAEPKKDDKGKSAKPAPGGINIAKDVEILFGVIAALVLIYVFFSGIFKYFRGSGDGTSTSQWEDFKNWLVHFIAGSINVLTFVSVFLTLIFLMGIYYSKFRRDEIIDDLKHKDLELAAQAQHEMLQAGSVVSTPAGPAGLPGAVGSSYETGLATVQSAGAEQWKGVEKYMQSRNPSDMRLAVLEADILLYDMLEQIGFEGDTIADKLKSADPASFNTLNEAWSAHKVRNIIAHEGSNYEITYDIARRAINSYKKVFDEFYFI
ncbi:MAG: hypothetical protein WCG97_03105 [bacterium]